MTDPRIALADDVPPEVKDALLRVVAKGWKSQDEFFRVFWDACNVSALRAIQPDQSQTPLIDTEQSGHGLRHWRHKKRGSTYTEIGRGKMQADHWCTTFKAPLDYPEADMADVVIYRSESDGTLWVRPVYEFEDGRFEAIARKVSESTPRASLRERLSSEGAIRLGSCTFKNCEDGHANAVIPIPVKLRDDLLRALSDPSQPETGVREALWPFIQAARIIERRPQDYGDRRIASFGGLIDAHDLYPKHFIELLRALSGADKTAD